MEKIKLTPNKRLTKEQQEFLAKQEQVRNREVLRLKSARSFIRRLIDGKI